jgi:hypothetical protein
MRRAARAWAAGSDCSQCPHAPQYPARCVSDDAQELWRDDVEGEGGAECPVFLGQRFERYFTAWNMLEKGVLPESGGWAEQPYYWVQAFEVIGAALARAQREQMKEAQEH